MSISYYAAYESANCTSVPHMVILYNNVNGTCDVANECMPSVGSSGSLKASCIPSFADIPTVGTNDNSIVANITVYDSCETKIVQQEFLMRVDSACRATPMAPGQYYTVSCDTQNATLTVCSDSTCKTGCEASSIALNTCVDGFTATCSNGSHKNEGVTSGSSKKKGENLSGLFLVAMVWLSFTM